MRDQPTAGVYSKYGYVPFYDGARGVFEWLRRGDLYKDYIKSGARYSDMLAGDRTDLTQELEAVIKDHSVLQFAKELADPRNVLNNLQKASEVMEQATRIMEYARAKKAGVSDQEAANAAKTVTLNFARHGHKAKLVNMVKSFFNAQVQDVDKFIKAHKNNPLRTVLKAGLYITMPTIALWILQKDDEAIKQLPTWRRTYFWNINFRPLTGTDFIISMPKPFLLGQIYGTSVEAALDYTYSKDPKAIERVAEGLGTSLIGPSDMIPDLMKPTIENISDYSFFKEQKQTPMGVNRLPTTLQTTAQTSLSAQITARSLKKLGLEFSPIHLDNFVRGHFAGLGKYAVNTVDRAIAWSGALDVPTAPDEGIARLPGLRAFTHSPFAPAQSVHDFYQSAKQMESLLTTGSYATKNKLGMPLADGWWDNNGNALVWYSAERGRKARGMRKAITQISEINEGIALVRNSDMDPKEKTERMKELGALRDNIAKVANTIYVFPGR